jgi:hypothetical protein
MRGAMLPLPKYAFMAWCSIKKSSGTTSPLNLKRRDQSEDIDIDGTIILELNFGK